MQCIFQLVSAEHGFRSDPFACSRDKLLAILKGSGVNLDERKDDMVMCLAEIQDNGEFKVSKAPLMRLSTWRNYFPEIENVQTA